MTMRMIRKIEKKNVIKRRLKVAAYARVSLDTDMLRHSLSEQVSYYNQLIQNNKEWEFAGIFADQGISGTSIKKRDEFNRMINEAKKGNIDIILTKSISRFARNTVDLLETVRMLKNIGVEVRFEKERINTFSKDGELMLSILASFAQSEAESISSNVKWAIQKKFENGKPMYNPMFGFDYKDKVFTINKEEAKIIKEVFKRFIAGESYTDIARAINKTDVRTRKGMRWNQLSIKDILRQEKYAGFSLLQKRFIESPLTHKSKRNKGELPQYIAEGTHPAIVSKDTFNKAKERIEYITANKVKCHKQSSWFTGLVKCPICGRSMIKINNSSLSCIGYRKNHTCENMETLLIKDLERVLKGVDLKKVDYIIFNKIRTTRFSRKGHSPADNNFSRNIKKGDFKIVWKH